LDAALEEPADGPETVAAEVDLTVDLALVPAHPHDQLLDRLARSHLSLGVTADAVGDDVQAQPVVAGIEVFV